MKFINANGTVNKEALKEALSQQFKSTGEVSIPALKMVDEEEDDLR